MKKLLKLIVLLLLTNTMLNAQYTPLVEEGRFWIYLNYSPSSVDFPKAISGHAITFLGDTTINFIPYKKVYRLNLKGGENCPPVERPCWHFDIPYQTESKELMSYVREDTIQRQVYNLPIVNNSTCSDDEVLLFDFSLQVGDTLNCNVYEAIWASSTNLYQGGIVDSIKIFNVQNELRNTIFTYGFYNIIGLPAEIPIPISEGMGYANFGLFYEPLLQFYELCEGDIGNCNLILSNNSVGNSQQFNAFPNPSNGLFQISMEKESIKIIKAYSILGQLIKEVHFQNSIDLSTFEDGVYLLELTTKNDERFITKINKQN